jgi:hypothetical protein
VTLSELADELGRLFDTALDVEPAGGINDAWAKVLAAYGVAPIADSERAAKRAQLDLARGALPGEVAACARVAIGKLGDASIAAAADELWRSIEPKYLSLAKTRPKSMFAFAIQTAHAKARAPWQRPPGGYVIKCSQCGGPRLDEQLSCRFCGKDALGT